MTIIPFREDLWQRITVYIKNLSLEPGEERVMVHGESKSSWYCQRTSANGAGLHNTPVRFIAQIENNMRSVIVLFRLAVGSNTIKRRVVSSEKATINFLHQ